MIVLAALLSAVGLLLWPHRPDSQALTNLAGARPASVALMGPRSALSWARRRALRCLPGRVAGDQGRVTGRDLLGLLEAIAPALEAGIAPAAALRIAAEARTGSDHLDPLGTVAKEMASAAAQGAALGPLWHRAAVSSRSDELLLLAQAWSLTEDMGVPLAQAVRTTAGLVEARIAQERRLAAAVAGAQATVNLLTVLPIGGPLLALVLGIGPGQLYGGSLLTQGSLLLGLCLAGIGRWWVNRMVHAVSRGPVIG